MISTSYLVYRFCLRYKVNRDVGKNFSLLI